jgi:hypothetical protein
MSYTFEQCVSHLATVLPPSRKSPIAVTKAYQEELATMGYEAVADAVIKGMIGGAPNGTGLKYREAVMALLKNKLLPRGPKHSREVLEVLDLMVEGAVWSLPNLFRHASVDGEDFIRFTKEARALMVDRDVNLFLPRTTPGKAVSNFRAMPPPKVCEALNYLAAAPYTINKTVLKLLLVE